MFLLQLKSAGCMQSWFVKNSACHQMSASVFKSKLKMHACTICLSWKTPIVAPFFAWECQNLGFTQVTWLTSFMNDASLMSHNKVVPPLLSKISALSQKNHVKFQQKDILTMATNFWHLTSAVLCAPRLYWPDLEWLDSSFGVQFPITLDFWVTQHGKVIGSYSTGMCVLRRAHLRDPDGE